MLRLPIGTYIFLMALAALTQMLFTTGRIPCQWTGTSCYILDHLSILLSGLDGDERRR